MLPVFIGYFIEVHEIILETGAVEIVVFVGVRVCVCVEIGSFECVMVRFNCPPIEAFGFVVIEEPPELSEGGVVSARAGS